MLSISVPKAPIEGAWEYFGAAGTSCLLSMTPTKLVAPGLSFTFVEAQETRPATAHASAVVRCQMRGWSFT